MKFSEVSGYDVPISLLLEADPCEQSIRKYRDDSWCFVYEERGQVVAACLAKLTSQSTAQVFNISVEPDYQKQGIGSELLSFALQQIRTKNVTRIELGTGSFGYQLSYYQQLGFRVDSVVKNHFLTHYQEAIFENGIQHKDMLMLYLDL
ncbi:MULTISPECIES: GNAT family N-acetyltransferase [unclassified Pseudoalteromonas]|uniref:GNAT family N-acetyltransferase n=1 Tax=unclassified Pseudoalteromonas TaxID=194690 RepID=UPI001B39F0EA|nr:MULTISPECIES: GNAT family N-acetyltransferase [unclassified Pseudoalteromonas]MBQ4845351.1 GNAT family N-acetyltransferase [Pseudoalteromonas sp. MMG005]MBQ4849308.1 GNAT family N-acetyltransferase [Pseudoalteromonas sp. MMG012]